VISATNNKKINRETKSLTGKKNETKGITVFTKDGDHKTIFN
jgi:hypothetical protein